jgi:acyl-coenzyme A thioesterase PaaI-like protein
MTTDRQRTIPIQDRIPHNHCYGCGPENPDGMQIKSYWDGEESVCTYMPRPEQCAGPTGYLYGGTIASLIDCHCVCTSIANYYQLDGREIGEGRAIWCVTGGLEVRYLKPTRIDHPVELRATIEECSKKKTVLACTLSSDGTVTAEGKVVAIRVPAEWRE